MYKMYLVWNVYCNVYVNLIYKFVLYFFIILKSSNFDKMENCILIMFYKSYLYL